MLSNAYFLAKFRFDTAENEPAKNLQKTFKKIAEFAIGISNVANFAATLRTEAKPPRSETLCAELLAADADTDAREDAGLCLKMFHADDKVRD